MIRALTPASSMRVWPGFCFAPAVMTTTCEPSTTEMSLPPMMSLDAGELRAVREVEHLGLDLLGRDVVQRDVAGGPADQRGVRGARSDAARADDGDFRVLDDGHAASLAGRMPARPELRPRAAASVVRQGAGGVAVARSGLRMPRNDVIAAGDHQRRGDDGGAVEAVEVEGAADDGGEQGDGDESGDPRDGVVDGRRDARALGLDRAEDRGGQRGDGEREAERPSRSCSAAPATSTRTRWSS